MTRFSAGVRAKQLCDIHLRKERIEILRVPNKLKSGKYNPKTVIPKKFKLGTGHEVFFKDKIKYVFNRYQELTEECIKRGFNVTDYSDAFKDIPDEYYNDWDDNVKEVRDIVVERITERLNGMKEKDLKYYSEQKTAEELITILNLEAND